MPSAIVGALKILLSMDTAEFDTAAKQVSASAKAWSKDFKQIGQQATALGKTLTTTLTLPIIGAAAASSKAAIDFESSFAGVRKTVNATEPEFAKLAQGFRDLAKEIPVNVNELNKIGEAAGQLGIKKESILGFTKVMAELGVATSLSSDEAATALAQLANITQMPQDQFDRLGSTVVALGNNFATNETKIVDFGQRIAGAGHIAGLNEPQILAIGTAMASVGIEAEAGGTAVQKALIGMVSAVQEGGSKLDAFAKTAGMSAAEFKRAFEDDAGEAFRRFVVGLGQQGQGAIKTLGDVGLSNERARTAFLSLAGAGDLLTQTLDVGKRAWQENTALTEEATKRFAVTEEQLKRLWNRISDVGITLGNALLPAIDSIIRALDVALPYLDSVAKWFGSIPGPIQAVAIGFAAVVAAAGPALYMFGQMAFALESLAAAFTTNGIAMRLLSGNVVTLHGALIGLGSAVSVAAVAFVGWKIGRFIGEVSGLTQGVQLLTEAVFDLHNASVPMEQQQRIINQAIALGADKASTYAQALAFLQKRGDDLRAQFQATSAETKTMSDRLSEARAEIDRLTPSQRKQIDAAVALGESIADVGKQFGLSSDAIKIYSPTVVSASTHTSELTAEMKAQQEALKEITSSLDDLTSTQYNQIASLLKAGNSEATIAKAYKYTSKQVDLVKDRESSLSKARAEYADERDEQAKKSAQIFDRYIDEQMDGLKRFDQATFNSVMARGRLIDDGLKQIDNIERQAANDAAQRTMSRYDYERFRIQQWAQEQKDNFKGTEEQARTFYANIDALSAEKMAAVGTYWGDVFKGIGQQLLDLGTNMANTLAGMLTGTVSFKDGALSIWQAFKSGLIQIFSEMLGAFIKGFLESSLRALGQWAAQALGLIQGVGTATNIASSIGTGASVGAGAGGGAGGGAGAGIGAGAALGTAGLGVAAVGAGYTIGKIGYEWATAFFGKHVFTPISESDARSAAESAFGPDYEAQFGSYFDWSNVMPGQIPGLDVGGEILASGLAMVHAGETVTPAEVAPFEGSSGQQVMQIQLNADGKTFAEWMVTFMPGAVRRLGLSGAL